MSKNHGYAGVALAGFVGCLTFVAGLPILSVGSGAGSSPDSMCTPGQLDTPSDGSPTILGPATLTSAELDAWWAGTGRGQPSRLVAPIHDVTVEYLQVGDAEGVRGDLALAQAIHETGYFTSADTARSNFAGIAHYDGAGTGRAFSDPVAGVRAHIQLLKKYAAGNDVDLAYADVAPDAGARATTWAELAGTWATATDYWTALDAIYDAMLAATGRAAANTVPCTPPSSSEGPPTDGGLTDVRGITVASNIAGQLDAMLSAAETDGISLTGSGYRSHERQIELRRSHCGTSDYAIYQMPSSQCSPPTARPGNSLHEQGLAIDFLNCSTHSTTCWQWLDANAAAYGFHNLTSEPWHWSVNGD